LKEQDNECTIGTGEGHNNNERSLEREGETDEDFGKEEKYLTREEESQRQIGC